MSDSTLDDLILTDPEPEGGKSKGILALLALVVLLIIIGAVLAKMIFSSPDDVNSKDNNATTEIKKDVATNNSSVDMALDNSKKAKEGNTSALDADLTPLDDSAIPSNVETVSVEDKPKQDNQKVSKSNDSMSIDSVDDNSNAQKTEPAVEKTVKKVEHKVKPKVVHKPKPKPKQTTHIYGGHGNTYIQVGSFSKGPNQAFISKIIKSGFRYRIKEVNGFRRVYVGPFTASEASRVLGKVKAKISPSAFIKK